MNYTENYHLPQWEETDRIMRTDFNDAMAGIESGLSNEKTERLALEEQMRLAEAGTSAAAQTALQNGLFRLAYNRWYYLTSLAEVPRQIGFFRQGFARDEKSPTGGMLQMEDRLWTANSEEPLTLDNMRSSIRALSAISYDKGTDTCSFTFTPPYIGYLSDFYLTGRYWSRPANSSNNGEANLRMYDDSTGELLLEKSVSFRFAGQSGAGMTRFTMDYFLRARRRYRIEVQLEKLDIACTYQMDFSTGTTVDCFDVRGRSQETVDFTHRFQFDDASLGGLILAHYTASGRGGVTVSWQGETLSPYKIRNVTYRGQTVKEAEFRLRKAVPADSTATLTVHCEKDGEFSLYDWGGMLI